MKKQRIFKKEITKEEEQEIRENLKENPLTKKDKWAMYIAALTVLVPAILIVIGIFVLFRLFFFMRG